MQNTYRIRRVVTIVLFLVVVVSVLVGTSMQSTPDTPKTVTPAQDTSNLPLALTELEKISVKGRAPKTDYSREQFGAGWTITNGCDTRNIILNRDLLDAIVDEKCNVLKGTLHDPYTGKTITFKRGASTSGDIQIDHVVALSDAWQKGAQQLTREVRISLANDPLELLAVDGPANQQKSDGDAATWLPPYKPFRCQYVARQIAIKIKYGLWLTSAEKNAMSDILETCPYQTLPKE